MDDAPTLPHDEYPPPVRLDDGTLIEFRPITPAARPLIQQAMARLSPETSRRRFFTVRYRLSEAELDRYTHPDGYHQHAVGALARLPDGRVEGVGVARFFRVPQAPDAAEVAVVVVDAYQRRGIGRRLLATLARLAAARGIERLRGIVLEDNVPMLSLLARYAPKLVRSRAGDHFDIEVSMRAVAA
jgi:GNAT superfamily N-acetyltransferase